MAQQPSVNMYDQNNFPFHNLSNNEFTTLNSTNKLTQCDMDRLSQLKFNPFQFNQNIALSGNNTNLDKSFNTNGINCEYYLRV